MPKPAKKSRFRGFLKRQGKKLLGLACFAALCEGGIAGFSIYQEFKHPRKEHNLTNNYLIKNTKFALECGQIVVERPVQTLTTTAYALPYFLAYHLEINQSLEDKLNEAVQHENTQKSVKILFDKDDKINFSEIGGLLCLDKDKNDNYYLRFYDLPSQNEINSLELIRKSQNYNEIFRLFKEERIHDHLNENEILDKHNCIDELIEKTENSQNKKEKEKLIEEMAKKFLWLSDSLYYPSETKIVEYIYKNLFDLKGTPIGLFHTHNMSYPPTPSDISVSNYIREFVLVRWKSGKYELFDLYKGKIRAKYLIPIINKK